MAENAQGKFKENLMNNKWMIKNHLESDEKLDFFADIYKSWRDLYQYRYSLYNFISSSIRSRYRRSALGFLWSLLNPLFTMIIMSAVFSTIYRISYSDFGIYIFSGLLPWNLLSNSVIIGSQSIINSEGYLKKVYVPKLLFPFSSVGVEVINFLFSLTSLFIIALLLGAKISTGLFFLPIALLLTTFFLLGLVLIVSIATVYFRDMSHIIQIFFMGLFYLTPIIYKQEILTKELLVVIYANPFYYFIELFHKIIYEAKIPDSSLWISCIGLTFSSICIGMIIYRLKEKDIIYRL